ncbi:TPA: hypothetical protein U1B28_000407 [Streptococcus suis]|uniref:hypothetical protein n=1 Tax=Streptococcus suis TaxID=1307 RepID=UPI00209BA5B8|nr:hypothetical protein [Streptococcus suis]MCO8174350.1 hypothetical protein [Streptococcus suis]MCO8208750.1 hypothetical protein [Streptococcus suis]HEM3488825.1 hypothetical protein [Streptococcus suis]HEM3506781.1 hypothetical protein [Streptococcus suis]
MTEQFFNIPFVSYFITTNNHGNPNFIERDTFSYRFNRNIVTHTQSRYIAAHLPKTLEELVIPWPLSSFVDVPNYITEYINIELLNKNKDGIIDLIKQTPLGCVFIPEELRDHPFIKQIQEITLPVIFLEDGVDIPISQLQLIVEKNSINASQIIANKVTISDKTKIEPISIPHKHFLRPLEIAINRNRGLYLSIFENRQEPKPFDNPTTEGKLVAEEQAISDLKYYLKLLIAEKYIIYLAKHEKGIDFLIEIIRKWDDSIDTADLDLDILEKYFLNLSDYFFEKFDEIVYRTDMVFVLPMVNKTSVDLLNREFQLRLSKPVLRQIYDFSGYYGIGGGKDFETMLGIISDRESENSILDSLSLNFTLDTKSPYVRLPNLPSQDITVWYSHMYKNTMKNANLSEIEKFNNNFHKISEKLKLSLDDEFIDILVKYGKHIKFITDAPIEWVKYKNTPLGLIKSISRLPIIPGNTLVNSAKHNLLTKIPKATVSFLIINALNPNDTLYKNGKKLGELLKEYFPKHCVNYYEVKNKTDFIHTMNENPSTFFIYYGHGSMPEVSRNQPDQIGKLHIGDDEIDMIELENNIKVVPAVTILGACQTQVLDAHYLNIGNMFLGLGSQSVLATYFPVDGFYTFSLIESIFRHLKNFLSNQAPEYIKNWSDIILQARRTHYIIEPVNTIIEYLDKKGDKTRVDSESLSQYVMKYCIESSCNANTSYISVMEQSVIYRDKAYKEYFKNYPESTRMLIDYIFKHNYVFPESIIFTSLGSPEKIKFV